MTVDFVIRYFGYSITLSSEVVNPGGRAVEGLGLRPLACRDCGFKFHQEQGYLSRVSVVSCTTRGFCYGPIPRPEESYRVCVCH
jgi:hypothetical protein